MELSIIMVTIDLPELTQESVESFRAGLGDVEHELIIVDNNSNKENQNFFRSLADVFIETGKNEGFVATNRGLEVAKGDFFFIANNDLVACNDWYSRLKYHLVNYDIVGPLSNAIFGEQLYPMAYMSTEEFYTKTDEFYQKNKHLSFLTHHVGLGCALMERKVYDVLGNIEDFGLGGHEDADYCIRAKMAGMRLGIANDVFFHHYYNATYKNLGIDYKEEMEKSMKIIFQKYGGKDNFVDLLRKKVIEKND